MEPRKPPTLEKTLELVSKMAGTRKREPKVRNPDEPVQLAFWPDDVLAMPNALARSAIFAVIRRGNRRMLQDEQIMSRKDGFVTGKGLQLDQADGDLWLHLTRFARKAPLGSKIHINRHELLRMIDPEVKVGASQYTWLADSIARLQEASFRIETKKYRAGLSLISSYLFDKETNEYWIVIDPEAAKLFSESMFGWIDLDKRRKLGHNDLAKWLQSYICSHESGHEHTINIELLHAWCGVSGRLRSFRTAMGKAIALLEKVEIINNAKLREDGKVTWFRPREDRLTSRAPLLMLEADTRIESV